MTRAMSLTRRTMLASTALILAAPVRGAMRGGDRPAYRNPALPVADRVRDLLGRMTIEEKVAQLLCRWTTKPAYQDAQGNFSEERAAKVLANGIGQISRISDYAGIPGRRETPFRSIPDSVSEANAVQRFLREKTRLGIPALFHDELAHGFLALDATIFPIAPALASTWDPELVEAVYSVAAREARLRGTTVALTPVIDLIRDPRWGRVEEFFSEDPVLTAEMGIAAVRGLQGRQRPLGRDNVYVTLKHFVHGAPQGGLNIAPADMGERMARETFLVPFARVVKATDPAIIMPSYNEFQGVPSHANVDLLHRVGRDLLGFKGAYFSDYDGIRNLKDQHHVVATAEDAAVLALNAGVGADLPEGASYAHLPNLVSAGRVTEAQLDRAVAQILALKFEAGLFEHPYLDGDKAVRDTSRAEDVRLARKAAEKALVLLKNDDVLPLVPHPGFRLAVIGPNSAEPLFGGYSGQNDKAVGIFDGIKRGAPAGTTVRQADGVWITAPDSQGRHRPYSASPPVRPEENKARIAEAVALARESDCILLVVGDVPAVTREAVHVALPGDRDTLGLFGDQDALIEALAATGKPIVTLLLNGRPLAIPRLAQVSGALLEGWYLGQEGGNAFADIVFGKANPGGKLPMSFPRTVGDLPVWYNRHPSAEVNVYIEGKGTPLFPFGHGLSYTRFEISAPRLYKSRLAPHEGVSVEVTVANIGARAGDEVVQIYIRDEVSSVPRPVLELKAFRRVTLQPGESRTLRFDLSPDDLAFWDAAMQWSVEPGSFTIFAGPSSAQLKSTRLEVVATAR